MTGKDQWTEKEKKTIRRISEEEARKEARETSFKAFLEYLQKELQKILPEKTVKYATRFSPADFFSKEYLALHGERVSEYETRFLNICSFEECDLRYAFGIFPRHISRRILIIDPVASETLRCVIHHAKALPILKESVARFAWVLHIKNLTIRKMYGEGNLSLADLGGELSPAEQHMGDLTIVEK